MEDNVNVNGGVQNNDNGQGVQGQGQQNQPAQNTPPATMTGTAGAGEGAAQGTQGQQSQPAQPVQYDFKALIPDSMEFSQEESDKFVGVIKDMNLNSDQANSIVKYGMEWGQRLVSAVEEQRNAQINEWGEDAKKQLGADYDKVVGQCGVAVEHLEKSCPGIRDALNETGAGNRIEIVRAFALLGKMLQGDPGMAAGAGATGAGGTDMAKTLYPSTDFSKYR